METIKGGKYPLISHEEYKALNETPGSPDDTRPTVLHVALEAPGIYSSHGISEGFRRNGYYVQFFNWQALKIEYGVEGMLDRLLTTAGTCNPELIFLHVQSQDIIDAETAEKLKAIAYTVMYTFDCREKDKTEWLYELAPHVDRVYFSNLTDVKECVSRGIYNTEVMQSSCDIDFYKKGFKENIFSYPEVAFVGGDYSRSNMNFPKADERKAMVEFMRNEFPTKFASFGMGQMENRFIKQQEEVLIYNHARICLSQNNYARPMYTSDRIWRIMASGCMCLAENFEGLDTMFEVGKHLDTWETLEELKDKTRYYLRNHTHMDTIAWRGMEHVRNNHSWQKRFELLKQQVIVKAATV